MSTVEDLFQQNDRAEAIAWAREVVADPSVVYLDTETTGLDDAAEIIELAVLDQAGQVRFHRRFRPSTPIPAAASFVHHIFDADVAAAPRFADCWAEIAALLQDKRVVSYGADFDARLLLQTLARYELVSPLALPLGIWDCAMEWYAAWVGDWSDYHGNYRYQKLQVAAAATGVVPDHSALGDARACRAVVCWLSAQEG